MNNPKICSKCGDPMINKNIIYTEKIFGKEREVCEVAADVCTSCDNVVLDTNAIDYVNQKKQEIVIDIMQNKDAIPLLISNIKKLRLFKKLNQKQLGSALGVTEQRYGAIERNTNTPTVLTGHQIAYILGENPNNLYELVYITKPFYEKLKDLEIIESSTGFKFTVAQDVKEAREKLYQLRAELKELNDEMRVQRFKFQKNEITEEEYKKIEEDIDMKKNEIKLLKDDKTNGMEIIVKKMESNRDLIIKQENVIDVLDWERVQNVFKKELEQIYFYS